MWTEILTGSVLLGLASCPVSAMKKPRFFWGSAAFDPISVFWLVSFFLYGPAGALLSSLIGSAAIARFSREPTPVLGAALKFTGTMTVWLTLYGAMLAFGVKPPSGSIFADIAVLVVWTLAAGAVRTAIEIPACWWAIPYFLSRSAQSPMTARDMVEKFGGMARYIAIMTALNFYLTFIDTLLSWLILFPTGLFSRFSVY